MRPNQTSPNQPFKIKHKQDTPSTEELKKQLDTSSALNRTLGLAFMSVLIYMLITIASITDMTLLLPDSLVTLPIINIEIGLKAFFIAAPILVLGLHLNMLLNLYRHNAKVQHWLNYQKDRVHTREELHPFIFNNLSFPDSKGYRTSAVLVGFGACYLPLMVMLLFQLRFSDFQSFTITFIHFLLLISTYGIILSLYRPVNHLFYATTRRIKSLLFYFITGLAILYGFSNILILCRVLNSDYSRSLSLFMNCPSYVRNTDYPTWLFNQVWYKPKLDVSEASINKEIDAAYILHYINKENLSEERARKKAINKLGKTIYLTGRSLRYANFEKTDFSGVDLSQSNLLGAKLQNSNFQKVNLRDIKLHGADLRHAKLQGSDLSNSELQGIDAGHAKMGGAVMRNINLQGANLIHANMDGCDLSGAKMQCSDLQNASMKGCKLSFSDMQGVNLTKANMSGAILSSIKMQGATLTDVNTSGALFGRFYKMYDQSDTIYLYGAKGRIFGAYLLDTNAIDTSTTYDIDVLLSEVLPFLKKPGSYFDHYFQLAKENLKSNTQVKIYHNMKIFLKSRKYLLSNKSIPLSRLFFTKNQVLSKYGYPLVNPEWKKFANLNDSLYQHLKNHVPQRLEEFREDSAHFIFSTTQF